ncbi:MAG: F0F1 ATP synthase subunit B [Planctomycetales bacterium]
MSVSELGRAGRLACCAVVVFSLIPAWGGLCAAEPLHAEAPEGAAHPQIEVRVHDEQQVEQAAAKIREALGPEAHVDVHYTGAPLGWKADLAIWSAVVFILFVLVLRKFAWDPLSAGLNSREERIRRDIEDAEQARRRAERMLDEHAAKLASVQDEVKEILAEARRDAEHTRQDIISDARNEAEASRQRAIVDIERARDQAMKELFDSMGDLVTQATAHVVGRSLGDADHDRLIDEALVQFREQAASRN